MRNFLIVLAALAPLTAHAAPQSNLSAVWGESVVGATTAIALFVDNEAARAPFDMAMSTSRPTGGMPGALSGTFNADVSTDLLDAVIDEIVEAEIEPILMPFRTTTKLPPLAGAWLLGLTRPPVLLPEPFSYSILSIGLVGFIVSRFFRTA